MRVYEKPPMFLASFLRFMAFRELLPAPSVSGGAFNTASGDASSVSGGDGNTASGTASAVSAMTRS